DLARRLEHGAFPERVAERLRRLEFEDEHVREPRGPEDDQDEAGDHDGGLDERAPRLRSLAARLQCSSTWRSIGTAVRPGLAAALDSSTGISRAPQSGLKKLGISFQSPGRW